ncbi:MAG: TetR/AcrR family transcriptional regulator [Sporolactobacillus sp.]|nr:TetR/AcrR family transcriptional regulator [Sporolactobacillus sp.]MCI1881012.1 TetR/AcrR family transcriptional regulator [Sporolactobacillus sp.]
MDGYQKRTEKKKRQIKQAAFDLFNRYSIEKVTMKDIAEAAHVSPVTIYKYFGNKDELLRVIAYDFIEQAYVFFHDLLTKSIPFPQKIEELLDYSIRQKKVFNEDYFKKLYFSDPRYVKFANSGYMKRVEQLILQLIRQGKAEGYVNPELPETIILQYVQAVIRAFTEKETALKVNETSRVYLVDLFFYGLAGRAKGKKFAP